MELKNNRPKTKEKKYIQFPATRTIWMIEGRRQTNAGITTWKNALCFHTLHPIIETIFCVYISRDRTRAQQHVQLENPRSLLHVDLMCKTNCIAKLSLQAKYNSLNILGQECRRKMNKDAVRALHIQGPARKGTSRAAERCGTQRWAAMRGQSKAKQGST